MTDYGNRGRQLLLELINSEFLPAYNEDLVRLTLQECNLHYDELSDLHHATTATRESLASSTGGSKDTAKTKDPPIEYSPAMTLHAAALERNKRCLMAYHSFRLDKLRGMRMETANAVLPSEVRSMLSEAETDFYAEYDQLVSDYATKIGIAVGSDLSPPEEENYIQVRVIQPGLGKIVTESGSSLSLDVVGSTHFVRRADIEHLVVQGMLEQMDTNPSESME